MNELYQLIREMIATKKVSDRAWNQHQASPFGDPGRQEGGIMGLGVIHEAPGDREGDGGGKGVWEIMRRA